MSTPVESFAQRGLELVGETADAAQPMPFLVSHGLASWARQARAPARGRLAAAKRGLGKVATLHRVLDAFDRAGIDALVFKGPALSQLLYGAPDARQYGDLDLLVHRKDARRAIAIVEPWAVEKIDTDFGYTRFQWRFDNVVEFRLGDGNLVEVHWALFHKGMLPLRRQPDAWTSRRHVDIGGRPVPALADEGLLHMLLLHGNKHMWYRVGWLVDIAALVALQPPRDWDAFLDDARRRRTLNAELLGLRMAHDLLGAPVPPEIVALAADERFGRWADRCRSYWFREGRSAAVPHDLPLRLAVMDTRRDRLRYRLYLALVPKPTLHRELGFPRGLWWLYWPIHAWRSVSAFVRRRAPEVDE